MKTPVNEIAMFYDPQSNVGKQTFAHAKAISRHVKTFDYDKKPFTTAMLQDLLNMMQLMPKKILDKSKPQYQNDFKGKDYDDEGWLNVIINNPQLIKSPIVVYKNKAIFCENPTDIYTLVR